MGIVVKLRKEYKQEHHIIPRAFGGSSNPENRVSLHIYCHGLAHAIRFLWSNDSVDLDGINSACRTLDQIIVANKNRQKGSLTTTKNPQWQTTFGQKGRDKKGKPAVTGAAIAAGSLAGSKYQKVNSKKRVNILTWFMSTLVLEFTNGITTVIVQPAKEPFDCNSTIFVKQLQNAKFIPQLEKQPQRLTKLLSNTNNSILGWSLTNVIFENTKLPRDLVFNILANYIEPSFQIKDPLIPLGYDSDLINRFVQKAREFKKFAEDYKGINI